MSRLAPFRSGRRTGTERPFLTMPATGLAAIEPVRHNHTPHHSSGRYLRCAAAIAAYARPRFVIVRHEDLALAWDACCSTDTHL
jgi:hypothetical protein